MIESEKIVGLVRYLEKIRKVLVVMLIIPLVATAGVYALSDRIIGVISKPISNLPLFFMTPVEGFMAKIKVSFFVGLVISIPILLCIVVKLASFKLQKKTRRLLYFLVIPFATASFIGGMLFGYIFILPTTIKFLLGVSKDFMQPMLSGGDYFSFIIYFLLSIGIVFELPIVLVALSRTGIITSKMLASKRKITILLIVIVLAILTPTPDAFTLLAVSLPMVILYEISIWWIYIMEKMDKKKAV